MNSKLAKQGNEGNPETKTVDLQAAARAADGPGFGGGIATNLDELAKRVSGLRKSDGDGSKTDTGDAGKENKLDADAWPDDMNDPAFLERGEVEGPAFGTDPDLSAADADE